MGHIIKPSELQHVTRLGEILSFGLKKSHRAFFQEFIDCFGGRTFILCRHFFNLVYYRAIFFRTFGQIFVQAICTVLSVVAGHQQQEYQEIFGKFSKLTNLGSSQANASRWESIPSSPQVYQVNSLGLDEVLVRAGLSLFAQGHLLYFDSFIFLGLAYINFENVNKYFTS